MKIKNLFIFILIIAIIGVSSYIAIEGVSLGKFKIDSVKETMNLGLDLKGGVLVVLEAETDETGAELDKKMQEAKSIINNRINALGLTEPKIVIEGKKRIRVELPGVKNTQEAVDIIGKTAELKFITLEDVEIPENFSEMTKEERAEFFKENEEVVLTGKNVKDSTVTFDDRGLPAVGLEFDKDGTDLFYEATNELKDKTFPDNIIYIILDNEIISYPTVGVAISDGSAIIQGSFTPEEANSLATLIRGGALPIELKEVRSSVIGPTLGLKSLEKSVYAGIIGLGLIFLFMIIYYRIPGLVSSVSLSIYILILLATMMALNATLTLPGIAGIILSIGMAVDANVVIFERIKEELRLGKTLRSAVDAGFKRALRTIMDSNLTTFIAGIVLFYFGTGPIKGFAVTLMIGLGASLLTAVFITKFLLKLIIGMNITKNTKLYGA